MWDRENNVLDEQVSGMVKEYKQHMGPYAVH